MQKKLLARIVAIRTRLGQRGYEAREAPDRYGKRKVESDSDHDTDSDPDSDRITGWTNSVTAYWSAILMMAGTSRNLRNWGMSILSPN